MPKIHVSCSANRFSISRRRQYRRDEIDASHYPVFHQMEGVRVWSPAELRRLLGSDAAPDSAVVREFVMADLKRQLDGLVRVLFGDAERR